MLKRKEVQAALDKFGREVVLKSRSNFLRHNVSGKGAKSIDFNVDVHANSFEMEFSMADYMEYQDKGVKGTQKGTSKAGYKYTNKRPPLKAFDQWVIRRGLAPRGKDGKFMSRQSLKFAIANKIYKEGIKPKLFFTKAFDEEFRTLPDEIVEAYGLDVEQLMKSTLNTNK